MEEKILIIDFGSQYTQLIARRVRELNVYCEIIPHNKLPDIGSQIKGIILSGSPFSVQDDSSPGLDLDHFSGKIPILGICYGAQFMAKDGGGTVSASSKREYGRAHLSDFTSSDQLFHNFSPNSQVWMSHADTITQLPEDYNILASTSSVKIAAFKKNGMSSPIYGIQFHPEVTHTEEGKNLLKNFIVDICGCKQSWTPASFVTSTVQDLTNRLGDEKVVLGLSGGVDSTVAAILLHRAIGPNLYCVFIDNGLLRKNEFETVMASYKDMGLHVIGVDSTKRFLKNLEGVSDPEKKRKIIGKEFIDVFDEEAHKIEDIQWLAQGTIYPDVIESISVLGPSATIKSHHNVGGLPEKMKLKIVEPLRSLFKDEVRRVGEALDIDKKILSRHPFPGPGLAVRILGEITAEKVRILQEADAIFIDALLQSGYYDKVWQALAVLLPIQSVGVMGDERTYEFVVCLRAVASLDGMTADWSKLPDDLLASVSNNIINNIKGINRVVYDISSKPPATIEWE